MVCTLPRAGDLAGHAQRPLHRSCIADGLLDAPSRHQAPIQPALKAVALLLPPLQAHVLASAVQHTGWQAREALA